MGKQSSGSNPSDTIAYHFLVRNLPPPLRPDANSSDDDQFGTHGSLSDFSDYDSSNEDAHNRGSSSQQTGLASTSTVRKYVNVSDDELDARKDPKKGLLDDEDDPFADPFADQSEVGSIVSTDRRDHW